VTRPNASAIATYDRVSRWYDVFTRLEEMSRNAALHRLGVKERENVLEIGFGTGHGILALARPVGSYEWHHRTSSRLQGLPADPCASRHRRWRLPN